ncbi:MAG: S9 family peptidase [Herpetosiphonaceae bacterium]|nr:S9 family peptidase [Herpetosiphonaceae bacterium]
MPNHLQIDDSAPWKQRFRAQTVLWAQVAKQNPTTGLACTNRSGLYQLYAWDVPTGELRQLTSRPEGQLGGYLDPDGTFVYYLDDQEGDEIEHFVRVPWSGGSPKDVTPDTPRYASWSLVASQTGGLLGTVVAYDNAFHLGCLEIDAEETPGPVRFLHESAATMGNPTLSYGGETIVVGSTERAGRLHYNLVAFDTRSGAQIGELWDGPGSSLQPVAFAPLSDDIRLLVTTNRTGVVRPCIWNPVTSERRDLALAELQGDVIPWDWSPDGQRILLCQYHSAVQHLLVYDLSSDELTHLEISAGTYGEGYFASHDEIWTQWTDARHPGQLIALDATTGQLLRTILAAGDPPVGQPWQSVSFPSSDGQMIQGWLAVPAGSGPFPTILHTHGGPDDVQTEVFSPDSQMWLDHGFAFLTVNYRGSMTFGRAFEEQIWGDLGHWEVEDMVAAREWLVSTGIARPEAILLTGWSYGGYLTLMGLGVRPDLWAGGMAGIAIADWTGLYEDSAETLRGYQVGVFGGTPDEKPAEYVKSSPVTYVDSVKAPLLIIQGRHDTRTPPRQVEEYVSRLKARHHPVELHWFETGHLGAFTDSELSIAHYERMLRFAYGVLG